MIENTTLLLIIDISKGNQILIYKNFYLTNLVKVFGYETTRNHLIHMKYDLKKAIWLYEEIPSYYIILQNSHIKYFSLGNCYKQLN